MRDEIQGGNGCVDSCQAFHCLKSRSEKELVVDELDVTSTKYGMAWIRRCRLGSSATGPLHHVFLECVPVPRLGLVEDSHRSPDRRGP